MKLDKDKESNISFEDLDVRNLKFAIVQAEFNSFITDQLTQEAMNAFEALGGDSSQIDVFKVPGSFEIPLTAKKAAQSKKYDAIFCFGAVIKGETYHFESVADAAVLGISQVALETEVPMLHGILTTYTKEQAEERVYLGREYLHAALKTLQTLEQIERQAHVSLS